MSITLLIIILTCAVSIPAFSSEKLKEDLLFWPWAIRGEHQYYRFLSNGTIHADAMHLIFNMVSFYSFGSALEDYLYKVVFGELARGLYAGLYVSAIAFAVIPDYFKYQFRPHYRSLGASGAVSAVIFAAITIQPRMPIRFFFIPFNIPGYVFGICFLILSASLAKKGQGNIGHSAHFWGSVYGVVFTYLAAKFIAHVDLIGIFLGSFR